MKEVYKAALYLTLCLACSVICSVLVWNRPVNPLRGKHLSCVMQLNKDLVRARGLVSGFNYEALKQFAKDRDCEIEIHKNSYGKAILDSVKCGTVDMAIVNPMEDGDSALVFVAIDSSSRWVTGRDREWIFQEIERWMEEKIADGICDSLRSVYFSSQYNPHKKAAKGLKVSRICPYDEIIKEYADSISWDWKLLAAVIWKESRFSINSNSRKGASGLMQIMPLSAAKFNASNILDPQENIRTGAMMLGSLEKKYSYIGKDDRLKFVLAAYNAGPGNLKDAMDKTEAKGRNKRNWNDVSLTLMEGYAQKKPLAEPLDSMAEVRNLPPQDEGQDKESVETSTDEVGEKVFNGRETITFVRSVMAAYKAICKIYEE